MALSRLPLVLQAVLDELDAENQADDAHEEETQADGHQRQPAQREVDPEEAAGQRPREGPHRDQDQHCPDDEGLAAW